MKLTLCLLLTVFLFQCYNKTKGVDSMKGNGLIKDGYRVGTWIYSLEKNTYEVDWSIYENDSIKINLLSSWVPINEGSTLFKCLIEKERTDFYFFIQNYSTKVLSMEDYLNMSLKEAKLVESKDEFKYELYKINLEDKNKQSYFIKYYLTNEIDEEIIIYLLFIEKDGQIYNFLYRTINDENLRDINYQIFGNIVTSFKLNNKTIVSADDGIENYKQISFEELGDLLNTK